MSIMPPDPDSKLDPPPTPNGVATLMAHTDPSRFVAEVAGLIEYIADMHSNRCDLCEMIDGPCALIEFANTVSIAWLMERVTRG